MYNPATNSWTVVGSMTNARYNHTVTLLSKGEVLVAGGDVTGTSAEIDPDLDGDGQHERPRATVTTFGDGLGTARLNARGAAALR